MRAGVSDVAYVKHRLERKFVLDTEAITLNAGDRVVGRQGARVNRSPSGVRNTAARIVGEAIRDRLGLNQRRFGSKVPSRVGNTGHAMKDTCTRAHSSFTVAEYIPGEAQARLEIRLAE